MLRLSRRLLLLRRGGYCHGHFFPFSPLSTQTQRRPFSTSDDDDLPRSIADLINAQHVPWPPHLPETLNPLISRLTASTLLLTLPLLNPAASALPLLFPLLPLPILDRRHASLALRLLIRRRGSPSPSIPLRFLLSLPPHLLHDSLFNLLIRSLPLPSSLRILPLLPVPPSVFTFNSLLSSLLRRGRTCSALQLFDKMLRSNIPPDTCTFNTLIRGLSLNGQLSDAFRLFRQMEERHRCFPDVLTYNTLLDGLCRSGKVAIARNFLNAMQKNNIHPNVVSYTTLLRGYCTVNEVGAALELLDEMSSHGLQPNKITYNTLIKGLCEARRMDLVKEILSKGNGFKPDTCTFNMLMAAHCRSGRVDDAHQVFDTMHELRVKTDSASYSTLIRGLCESRQYEQAEELVDDILEKGVLRRRGVCAPMIAAYNPIFYYLCENGKSKKAAALLMQLVERRATMDVAAFKTVILGYSREGRLREGHKMMLSMVRRGFKPDLETFKTLVEGFLAKEDATFAWKVLDKMLSCGHWASTSVFHDVLAGLLRKAELADEAADLAALMVERKIRLNADLSTDVVARLLEKGSSNRAFVITGLIYDSGYCVKMEKLVESMYKDDKILEAKELLMFSLERNEKLDAKIFARAISSLCANGRELEAFELFYGFSEKGSASRVSSSCLNDLRFALETAGRFREAQFVCKQLKRSESI